MFDDLRKKSAEEADFLKPEAAPDSEKTVVGQRATDQGTETTTVTTAATAAGEKTVTTTRTVTSPTPKPRARYALGLNPAQRFVLALILFLDVTVLGCFALLVFQRIDLAQLLLRLGLF